MGRDRDRSHEFLVAIVRARTGLGAFVLVAATVMLILAGATPAIASAQQSATATPLVFDGVTVVDVEHGKLLPAQRVVIAGTRIRKIGTTEAVAMPKGAQVVDARGKYLIPGLWDMHFHRISHPRDARYLWLIANGTTGVRDPAHVDSSADFYLSLQWRREIAAGMRVGPRLLTTYRILDTPYGGAVPLDGRTWRNTSEDVRIHARTAAEARSAVDSLKAVGADFVKLHITWLHMYEGAEELVMSREAYFAALSEGRRIHIPVIGHLPKEITLLEASDSGQQSVEHLGHLLRNGHLNGTCGDDSATDQRCAALAAHLRRNHTWLTPTLSVAGGIDTVGARRALGMMQRADMPLLAGTDDDPSIQQELALLVEFGLTPLQALQAATLNPARYLRGTDSLGTVAAGKLADLVLLDADPLTNIHNTTAIRAVVANGRYFDRAALDQLLAEARAKDKLLVKTTP